MNAPEIRRPPDTTALRVRTLEAFALEAPLGRTVPTPMMAISSVVNLLVCVRDDDGIEGWGEVWCNFPRFGVHHRARLLREVFAPLLTGRTFGSPAEAWDAMTRASNILRLQSGEPGPIAAVIAGIDVALHDIAGKRCGEPLWRMLGGREGNVRLYASLGRADDPIATAQRWLARGFRAFKAHTSGSVADAIAVARPLRRLVGPDCEVMLDANSSWEADDAIATIGQLGPERLSWVEEPIPVDAPAQVWRRLAEAAPMPLAGGENMLDLTTFDAALAQPALRVLQPDLTKWGGFSGCLPLARRVVAAGRRFCPHMFTGAPGVLASAHLLAASGSPAGLLEFNAGRNPLRDALLVRDVRGGVLDLGDAPGLGLEVDRKRMKEYLVAA
jgi:L-alanine-DL-glutamate epimerase-like enolase superfamily enzyme